MSCELFISTQWVGSLCCAIESARSSSLVVILSPGLSKLTSLFFTNADDLKHCDRLVELLLEYDERVRKAEYQFFRSGIEDTLTDDQVNLAAFDAKLSGGGDIYYRLAAVTAFVCGNSKRCHEHILAQLKMQQSGVSLIKRALDEFSSSLNVDGRQKKYIDYLNALI